ncbi:MAG: sodium-translocating pyrophosphatase, partial [Planctomycetota bacterium]
MESLLTPYAALVVAAVALVFAFLTSAHIKKQPEGNDLQKKIAHQIRTGAMAFLKTEYTLLAIFVAVVFGLLFMADQRQTAVAFVCGAVASGLAGWVGMRTATGANVRTTEAARTSLSKALDVAFSSGMVMGLCVVGLGLAGVTGLYLLWGDPQ